MHLFTTQIQIKQEHMSLIVVVSWLSESVMRELNENKTKNTN